MTQRNPGSLIQYQGANSLSPPWPAVICTDDMAPEDVLQARPYGNVHITLVLLLGEDFSLRWARTTELSEYDPCVPYMNKVTVDATPGLASAYEMANNVLEIGLGIDYWREQMCPVTIPDPNADVSEAESDSTITLCSDPELQQAIRQSRKEYYNRMGNKVEKRYRGGPTPSCSPSRSVGSSSRQRGATDEKLLASASSSSSTSKAPQNNKGYSMPEPVPSNTTPSSNDTTTGPKGKEPVKTLTYQPKSLLDNTWGSLNRTLSKATSDTVDGELSESNQFIQVRIGPTNETRILHTQAIWNRTYFRDPRRGLNLFHYNDEDKIWELKHPTLLNIQPSAFDLAAEYLESKAFGHPAPRNTDEMHEAFSQCVSAWFVAHELDMADLMDDIVDKLETVVTPDKKEVMSFAERLYRCENADLPCHERLKEYLVERIAEDWWGYIGGEVREEFVEMVRALPDLERDICARRVEVLEELLGEDDDDEEDEEEDEEEDDQTEGETGKD